MSRFERWRIIGSISSHSHYFVVSLKSLNKSLFVHRTSSCYDFEVAYTLTKLTVG